MLARTHSTNRVRPIAPEIRATSRPRSRIANVGMPRMSNFAAIACDLVGVQLHESQLRLELARGALEHRRHSAARAAPRRPEVHDDREIAARDVALEVGFRKLDGVPLEERPAARAALGRVAEPVRGHPVGRMAVRARDVQGPARRFDVHPVLRKRA